MKIAKTERRFTWQRAGIAQSHQYDSDSDQAGQMIAGRCDVDDQSTAEQEQCGVQIEHTSHRYPERADQHVQAAPDDVGQADQRD